MADIVDQIRKDTLRTTNNVLGINIMTQTDNENSLQRQETTFMYAQLLKDILIRFPSTEVSKQEMVEFCREHYADNALELDNIKEFEDNYDPQKAVWWYTRDTFLYRLLNKALRVQDIDVLYKIRLFIRDLNEQVEERHQTQFVHTSPKLTTVTVYRGCGMSQEEFDSLKSREGGGFMSISTFLSTSRDPNIALEYARLATGNPKAITHLKKVAVLLEIEIDVQNCQTPFTDVQTETQFEHENEILFTMGSVYRVISVKALNNGLWKINIKLTGEEDQQLKTLTEYMRKTILWSSLSASIASLMREMAHYNKAEQFLLLALQDPVVSDDFRNTAAVYNNLGDIYRHLRMIEKGVSYYQKSLDVALKHLPEDDPILAVGYANLGTVYHEQGDDDQALSYYHAALKSNMKASSPNLQQAAVVYINIAMTYGKQNRRLDQLNMLEKALEFQQKVLPSNHYEIGITFNTIGITYYNSSEHN
ncbi:unnamed protein product [Rotaria sp. Silwood2]|nr:unnamed protein product [Rotaria sp. Silwood2]CAF4649808.1 unnamed protein product [Rotaria sp. Silwood2]